MIKEGTQWPMESRRPYCVIHFTFPGNVTNSYVQEEFGVERWFREDFESLYTCRYSVIFSVLICSEMLVMNEWLFPF